MSEPEITGESRNPDGTFKEGVSGNPAGKPKGSLSITAEIKKKLEEVPEGQKKTYLQLLISRIMKDAIQDGDGQMISKIWAYVDGMPKESKDITSGGKPIPILNVFSDQRDEKDSEVK